MKVDGEWIIEQIEKYIEVLDQIPQRRPDCKAEGCAEYAAGLRDMAADICENIRQEDEWQSARAFLGDAFLLPAHGWEVVKEKKG